MHTTKIRGVLSPEIYGHVNLIGAYHFRLRKFSMKIEIITTLNNTLKETGFGSLQSCNNVLDSMTNKDYNLTLSVCKNVSDLVDVVKRKPDLVVLAVKYIVTKDEGNVWLSDYFERNHIKYSGSSRNVLKFDSNKVLAKTLLRELGINTANFFTVIPDQYQYERELPIKFPLFLKPLDAANGNGIDDLSFVTCFSDFKYKVSSLYEQFKAPVLAEEYLGGREFTVSIIQKPDRKLIVSAIEIVPVESLNGLRILGSKAKQDDSETLLNLGEGEMKDRIKQLAVDAFVNLGARDFGRIDIKSDKNGKCFFMEANLVPGMTYGSSYFPKACEMDNGLSYNETIEQILDTCLCRLSLIISPNNHLALNKEPMAISI